MDIKAAIVTKSKIFTFNEQSTTGFVSSGTWDVIWFDYDEIVSVKTNLEYLLKDTVDTAWREVSLAAAPMYHHIIVRLIFNKGTVLRL